MSNHTCITSIVGCIVSKHKTLNSDIDILVSNAIIIVLLSACL